MDQAAARALIEQHKDILSPAAKAEAALYRNTQCPMCGQGECEKRVMAPKVAMTPEGPVIVQSPFGDGPLPDGYAHCVHCNTDFNPRTGMIFSTDASMIHAPQ